MRKAAPKPEVQEGRRLEEGDILTIEEVAKLLRVGRTTVKRLMRANELPLPHYHIGASLKFDRCKVNEWYVQWMERETMTEGKRGNEREEGTNIKPIRKATR